jgi:hypothetical protein
VEVTEVVTTAAFTTSSEVIVVVVIEVEGVVVFAEGEPKASALFTGVETRLMLVETVRVP